MEKSDFKIGTEFYTATGKWRCTDIGTRVITAIKLDQKDERNYEGPPYSIAENVMDEYDMEGCSLDPADFEEPEFIRPASKLFNEIEAAFEYVSFSGGCYDNSAILDKSNGKIYYHSEYGDNEEEEQLPEDEYNPEIHIEIPGKNDLDLGRNLVFDFISNYPDELQEKVEKIFRRKGAYSHYKDFLDSRGLLQKWYDFENRSTCEAILGWCRDNKIDIA